MWQTRRVLYDVTAKGYSNRIQRLTALSEMAEVFGKTPEYLFSLTHPRSEICGVILIQCVFYSDFFYGFLMWLRYSMAFVLIQKMVLS